MCELIETEYETVKGMQSLEDRLTEVMNDNILKLNEVCVCICVYICVWMCICEAV